MSSASLNKNNSAVKRIMQEARELANDPSTDYSAAPLEDDIFEWHCTLRGPAGTDFEGGLYHFRILLPSEYPFRPPSIMILTPNGRFELNTKICISFTSYHEELWQPAWGVRTAIIGLQGFFPLKGQSAVGVGSIEYPSAERKRLAMQSREWVCPHCQRSNLDLLPDPSPEDSSSANTLAPSIASDPASAAPDAAREAPQSAPSIDRSPPESTSAQQSISEPIHTVEPLVSGASASARPGSFISRAPIGAASTHVVGAQAVVAVRRSSNRPPVMLDTAICVLLVLVCAMICRRLV